MLFAIGFVDCRPASPPASAGKQASVGVTIALDQPAYAPGDTARVTVINPTRHAILFAVLCDAFVEGIAGGEWKTVFEPDCSNVRVRPTRLGGGERVVVDVYITTFHPEVLAAHESFRLRLRFQFEDSGGYQIVYSRTFALAAP
jgi:hypothetical protein